MNNDGLSETPYHTILYYTSQHTLNLNPDVALLRLFPVIRQSPFMYLPFVQVEKEIDGLVDIITVAEYSIRNKRAEQMTRNAAISSSSGMGWRDDGCEMS